MLGALVGVFRALASVGIGIFNIVKMVILGPIGAAILKFLIFCFKSSFVLILFLMGGSFFLFLGVFYIYYKVYSNVKNRNKKVKKFFKGEMDAAEVESRE